MAYEYLAGYYDKLMEEVPYERFADLVMRYASKEGLILDLGCGTGKVLAILLKNGYQAEGLDLSAEMLAIAGEKLEEAKLKTNLYLDDMTQFSAKESYQVIFSFLDTVNYLKNQKDIVKTFKNVCQALIPGGWFIFDVHSLETIEAVFDGYSYNETGEGYTYIWNTFVENNGEYDSVYHELQFFIEEKNGLYRKTEEYHEQTIYPLKLYLGCLKKAGFEIKKLLYDLSEDVNEEARKIYIISKKCL